MSEYTINIITLAMVAGFYVMDTPLTFSLFRISRMAYPRTSIGDAMIRKYAGLTVVSAMMACLYILTIVEELADADFTSIHMRLVLRVTLISAMVFAQGWKAVLVFRLYHLYRSGRELREAQVKERS